MHHVESATGTGVPPSTGRDPYPGTCTRGTLQLYSIRIRRIVPKYMYPGTAAERRDRLTRGPGPGRAVRASVLFGVLFAGAGWRGFPGTRARGGLRGAASLVVVSGGTCIMEIVAARFPGVERCEMERIARWARRSPRTTLGAWPETQLRQMPPAGQRRLAESPICGCAADVEAVYLTLLDHHVLEVVRSATPESFTDRVIRFNLHAARSEQPTEPDPETLWCLQSDSTDAEHWDIVWKQYRKANDGKKTGEAMTLATRLRHRAHATERSAAKESPTADTAQPAWSSRTTPPRVEPCGGCVDADFCKLGASDLMKRVALDLRTVALTFDMDAVVHGRINHPKHLLIVHRVLAAYEAEAPVSLQKALAGAIYHPPIVSSLCWSTDEAAEHESTATRQESETAQLSGDELCSKESARHPQRTTSDSTPRKQCQGDKSPPVSPPPDGLGTALESGTSSAMDSTPSRERAPEQAKSDEKKKKSDAGGVRPYATAARTAVHVGDNSNLATALFKSLPVQSAQLQAAAMAGVAQVRPNAIDVATAAARARLKTPLTFCGSDLRPAWVGTQPPRPATSAVLSHVADVEEERTYVHRHRDHRWGERRKQRQERQAWLEKIAYRRTQHQNGTMTPTPTPAAQASQRSNSRKKQLGVDIPAFRQDSSRWGVLRTQSKLARQQDFVAGNQRIIDRSVSTGAIRIVQ